jgi:glycosyl hydrolase family 19 (putative chitinase)
MINRKFFFDNVRSHLFDGKLSQKQVDGLNAILGEWDAKHAKKDDRWLAYMLATTHHETDRTIQPIEEYGKGKGLEYGKADPVTGQTYYGRGFVQLTWKSNYIAMGKKLNVDLLNHPERALDLRVATQILFRGMMEGSFTGVKLTNYFNPNKEDWINARRIINGLDKANLIAAYGKSYYASISHTT